MPTPEHRHRLPLALAAVGTALALAACGTDESHDENGAASEEEQQEASVDSIDWRNAEIPAEEPGVPGEELRELLPESDDDLAASLGARATEELTRMAGVVDPEAASECPDFQHEEGEEFTCTVTFLGEDFDYDVVLGEIGDFTTQYESGLSEMPVVREHVEDSIRHQAEIEDVHCDMRELERVPQDERDELGIDCHALVDDEAEEWVVAPHMSGGIVVAPDYG
ncbi:hypothetical protein [Nocardiopsis salina]|uniref:hypothetical protein n=1 Tax=Nocardiopsis salina TaxID=245836 RepID=UPI00034A64F6|nr:hypothetical protein [Nocardiopsis salina]